MEGLRIEEHADKYSHDCSGGTKRKLSYGMAMLGKAFNFFSRYETTTTTSNTQQSIKKNINDLDNLLNNLSTHRLV